MLAEITLILKNLGQRIKNIQTMLVTAAACVACIQNLKVNFHPVFAHILLISLLILFIFHIRPSVTFAPKVVIRLASPKSSK